MPTVLDLTPHFRLIPPHSRPQPPGWALKRGFKNAARVSQAATSLSRPATKRTTTSTPRQNATVKADATNELQVKLVEARLDIDIDNYDAGRLG